MHGVVCLPDTFPQVSSKPLPEGDEQDNATDGENGSGGAADRRAYLLHLKFRSHSHSNLLHGKLARAG